MVQIPRLYSVYKQAGLVRTFQDILHNIFAPLFKVTLNPSSDPCLHEFLTQMDGMDCVDDESKADTDFTSNWPCPKDWVSVCFFLHVHAVP